MAKELFDQIYYLGQHREEARARRHPKKQKTVKAKATKRKKT